MEGNNTAASIFRFGNNGGSRKLTSLKRVSQLWMFGDVGVPKSSADLSLNKFPSGGYNTEFSTRQPSPPGLLPGQGWVMRRHLISRPPAATTGAPTSYYAMDTPKIGNGRIWLQIHDVFAINSFENAQFP